MGQFTRASIGRSALRRFAATDILALRANRASSP